jgi:hypothetical protein
MKHQPSMVWIMVLCHLGMSYYKIGNIDKAKAALDMAIALSPSFPGIEEAKQTRGKL